MDYIASSTDIPALLSGQIQIANVQADLEQIEQQYGVDLRLKSNLDKTRDDENYPQFSAAVRAEAASMAAHYEISYCLENSIRELVSSQLLARHGNS